MINQYYLKIDDLLIKLIIIYYNIRINNSIDKLRIYLNLIYKIDLIPYLENDIKYRSIYLEVLYIL
jgi:hypothetical protein